MGHDYDQTVRPRILIEKIPINRVKITPFCINFNFHQVYFTWMLKHKEELKNINNMNWWRSQKNEEERNLPRHPNRSANWIPARLMDIRNELIVTQLDYLFGKGGHLSSEPWEKHRSTKNIKCMRCNVSIEKLKDYQKGIVKLTDREKQRIKEITSAGFNIDSSTWDKILAMAIKRVNKHWDPLTIAKSKAILPTSRSRTLTYHHHGFCIDCWETTIENRLGYTLDEV